MDRSKELRELLIQLAVNLREEDLLEDPVLLETVSGLLDTIDPQDKIDPQVIQQLAAIENKQERFMAAMQILQVPADPESMIRLAVAMQEAGLLNRAQIMPPGEAPQDEALPEGHAEEPAIQEEDDFDPESADDAEDVQMDDKDVLAAGTHRW